MAIRDTIERCVLRTKRRLSGVINSPHAPNHQQQSNSTTSNQQPMEITDRSSTTFEDQRHDVRTFEEIGSTLKRLEENQDAISNNLKDILVILKSIAELLESNGAAPSGHIERCYFHQQFGRVANTCRPPCSLYNPTTYSISKTDGTFGKPRQPEQQPQRFQPS